MSADDGSDLELLPWLLPAEARPHMVCLLRFARTAHRLAHTAPSEAGSAVGSRWRDLDPEQYIDARGGPNGADPERVVAIAIARSMVATRVPPQHIRHFLQACERDAAGWSPESWSDLVVHARFAAASIGRHALAILGEASPAALAASDALCTAAWILDGLQRMAAARPPPRRPPPCIPARFLTDAMITTAHLQSAVKGGQTRAVLDRVLDGVDRLLVQAAPLPATLSTRGTRRHARILICRAHLLTRRLRTEDPLATTVRLRAWHRWLCRALSLLPRTPPHGA